MTGGTLIIKKGNLYCMTKVAHDGYDLVEKLKQFKGWMKACSTPKDIAINYLEERTTSNSNAQAGSIEYDFETNDKEHCVYEKTYNKKMSFQKVWDDMEEDLMEMTRDDDKYDEDHPYQQLACSYCDHILCIDMDNNRTVLDEEMENEA
jgi:hypothetical protein